MTEANSRRVALIGANGMLASMIRHLAPERWEILPFDLPEFDLTDPGGGPPGRQAHSLTYDPGSGDVILVGGVAAEGDTLLGDTWHYRGGWREATAPLPPRAYHQIVYNSGMVANRLMPSRGWPR